LSASTSIEQNRSSGAYSDHVDVECSWRSLHCHNVYTKFLWTLMISKVARWYTHAHMPVQYYGDMIDLCALFALRK